jgi:SAM-dependent methyltransferase
MNKNLFDLGKQYDEMLNRGIRLSGEDKRFFIAGRIQVLKRQLPPSFSPRCILDFGCGIGDTTRFLAGAFPGAEVVGVDISERALAYAEETCGSPGISFCPVQAFSATDAFDLCHVNGVFHHIQPQERRGVVEMIRKALVPSGLFALFENNPWNLGTRLVMSRIPFDRDARPLNHLETRHLLREGGFAYCAPTRFLFYFPRPLAFLRFTESWLARLPLGAQYYILAVK